VGAKTGAPTIIRPPRRESSGESSLGTAAADNGLGMGHADGRRNESCVGY